MSHLDDLPPWSEVLRAISDKRISQCCVGMHLKVKVHRLDPRHAEMSLLGGNDSTPLPNAYVCICGAITLGASGAIEVDDIATATGAVRTIELLLRAIRQLRPALAVAPDALLRTVANQIHADMTRQLAIQALKWNLPPYALLGRVRARPAECWHRSRPLTQVSP